MPTDAGPLGRPSEKPTSKAILGVAIALVAGVVLYLAVGMPGMNHGSSSTGGSQEMSGMGAAGMGFQSVEPSVFEKRMADPASFVINVHTPYEGELSGTDAFIVFDSIAANVSKLPSLNTPILVYCRSGNMSTTAAATLVALGYTDVVELKGGMRAWRSSGRSVDEAGTTSSSSSGS